MLQANLANPARIAPEHAVSQVYLARLHIQYGPADQRLELKCYLSFCCIYWREVVQCCLASFPGLGTRLISQISHSRDQTPV